MQSKLNTIQYHFDIVVIMCGAIAPQRSAHLLSPD